MDIRRSCPALSRRLLAVAFAVVVHVAGAQEIWRLDNLAKIGGQAVTVLDAPRIETLADGGKAVVFDGVDDGLFVPAIPFAGARQFTIEIFFLPVEGGPTEQRFLHAQDAAGGRALLETRLDGKGSWWLDTFVRNATAERGVVLVDPKCLHPTGKWYWAALRYDGKTLAHFINGRKELEREAAFEPIGEGQISLGVRQNRIHWFKGAIREVRFHRVAIAEEKLQRVR